MGKISAELRDQPIHVGVVMRGVSKIGDDGSMLNVRPTAWNKVQFEVETKK